MPHSEAKVAGRKVLILYKLLIRLVNLREKERGKERAMSHALHTNTGVYHNKRKLYSKHYVHHCYAVYILQNAQLHSQDLLVLLSMQL